MSITKKDVQHLANLVRLDLSEAEIEKYQKQLAEVLNYVDQLRKVQTKDVSPYFILSHNQNVFRSDEAEEGDYGRSQKLIDQSPQKENNLIKTKKIL